MNIYIGNLPAETIETELRELFAGFGDVISVTLMDDEYIRSGQTRYYAFVLMASKSDSNNAISFLNGKIFGDHEIVVKEALPLSNNNSKKRVYNNPNKRFNSQIRERWS